MLQFINRFRLILLFAIELIVASNIKWGQDRWKQIIEIDGKGYYAYLPAIFIYHDLQFAFHDNIEKQYSSKNTFSDFRNRSGDAVINKYFAGTSLAMLPFFLAGHIATILTGGLADGYSYYYQIAISLAAIFFSVIGFLFLSKLLRLYKINENILSVVIFAFAFATPLFYYTVSESSMSHVYSFAFINIFLYFSKRFFINPDKKFIVSAAFIYSLIVLIRPVNGLIILILPFLAGSNSAFKTGMVYLKNNLPTVIKSIILAVSILSIQFIIYYVQSGSFIAYSYGEEKLILNRPEIINILFSYKKGLFIYAPLLFLSIFGLIVLYKRNKFEFWSFSVFFSVLSYILSCWWVWWYGGSFGFRPFIEFYGLFAILLATLLSLKNKLIRLSLTLSILFCFILCQIQTYQYRYYFIHWENMDKEHYWRVFMNVKQLKNKDVQGNPNADLLEMN